MLRLLLLLLALAAPAAQDQGQDQGQEKPYLLGFMALDGVIGPTVRVPVTGKLEWQTHLDEANELAEAGRYSESLRVFERLFGTERLYDVLSDERKCRLHRALGALFDRMGLLGRAAAAHREAFALCGDAGALVDLAGVRTRQLQLDDAIMHLKHTLSLDERHLDALHNLGSLYIAEGSFNEGLHYYRRALSVWTTDVHQLVSVLQLEHEMAPTHVYHWLLDTVASAWARRPPARGTQHYANMESLLAHHDPFRDAQVVHDLALSLQQLGAWPQGAALLERAAAAQAPGAPLRVLAEHRLAMVPPQEEALRRVLAADVDPLPEHFVLDDLHDPRVARWLSVEAPDLLEPWRRRFLELQPSLAAGPGSPNYASGSGSEDPRLRVGIVSGLFFANEQLAGQSLLALLRQLQRFDGEAEVVVFACASPADEVTAAVHAAAVRFVPLPYSDAAARRILAQHQMDVLLFADAQDTFSFFLSLAAPGSLGGAAHGSLALAGADAAFAEPPLRGDEPRIPPSDFNGHTFFARNTLYLLCGSPAQLPPSLDAALGRILRRDPSAQIVIASGDQHGVATSPAEQELLLRRLRASIYHDADRVRFVPRLRAARLAALMTTADVVLVPPLASPAVALQALWAGTPVSLLGSGGGRGLDGVFESLGVDAGADPVRLAGDQALRRRLAADAAAVVEAHTQAVGDAVYRRAKALGEENRAARVAAAVPELKRGGRRKRRVSS